MAATSTGEKGVLADKWACLVLAFPSNVKKKKQGAKGAPEDEDSEASEDVDDLDDDEVSLGSLGEEDFSELGEDGGTFMDTSEEDDDDEDDEAGKPRVTAQLMCAPGPWFSGWLVGLVLSVLPRSFSLTGTIELA